MILMAMQGGLRAERIVTLVGVMILGLGIALLVDRGDLQVELPIGASLPLLWPVSLILLAVGGLGAEWLVRGDAQSTDAAPTSPPAGGRKAQGHRPVAIGPRVRLWLVPVALTAGSVLFLGLFDETAVLIAILLGAAAALALAYFSLYHTVDLRDPLFGAANTALNLLAHVAAFVLFGVIYAQNLRGLYSGPAVGLVTTALLYELLVRNTKVGVAERAAAPAGQRPLLLYAAIGGLLLGQLTWGINYWAVSALVAGSFLLVMFYVTFGLMSASLAGTLNGRVLAEFGAVSALALLVIMATVLLR